MSSATTDYSRHWDPGAGQEGSVQVSDGPLTDVGDWWPRIPLARRYRSVALGLLVSDGVCAVVGLLTAQLVLLGWGRPDPELVPLMVLLPLAWIASFKAFGLYAVRHLSAVEEFRRLIGATCVATSLVTLVRAWSNTAPYRKWLLITWLVALGVELVARRAWRWKLGDLRGDGRLACRTLILGTNSEAHRLATELRDPFLGFQVVGYVATGTELAPSANGHRVVGHVRQLESLIRMHGVECLFIAASAVAADEMADVARLSRQTDVELRVSANLADTLTSRLAVQRFGDVVSVSVKPVRMTVAQRASKRCFDVLVASVILIASMPVMIVAAVAVRLTSRGPIFFRQERATRGSRPFIMCKFRTMVERDQRPGETEIDLTEPFFKLPEDDPRVTKVGHFLRRFSIDELPQLWQVVRGHLSLVGPRPLPLEAILANPELMSRRHEVRAGITGWWQINGRSSIGAEEALRKDCFYIENWSLSLDLFILLKTAGAVVSRRGAH